MNIMCAFHYIRQTGSLFERQGGKRRHVCFLRLTTSFVQGDKTQKFRSFNIEGLGKFREVVLTRGVPINAIRVRFEEGWSYFLVWKRLGKRKISCFWGGHRL